MQIDEAVDGEWAPVLRQNVEDIKPVDGDAFFATMREPWKGRVLWFRQSGLDLLQVMQLYLVGFDHVKTGFASVNVITQGWVNGANRSKSAALQACIFASGLCALLEATVPDMFDAFFRQEDLARLTRLRGGGTTLTRERIAKWVNPTSRGDQRFAQRVADVFGFTVSEATCKAFSTLLDVRHGYIHEREKSLNRTPNGGELVSWLYSSFILVGLAGKALNDRLATESG